MGNSIGVAKTKLLLTFQALFRNLEVRWIEFGTRSIKKLSYPGFFQKELEAL